MKSKSHLHYINEWISVSLHCWMTAYEINYITIQYECMYHDDMK